MKLRRLLTTMALQIFILLSIAPKLAAVPGAPTPSGPPNGASVTVPFTISWSATLSPTEVNAGYNWQVSRSSSFSPLVLGDSTNPATTQDTISGLTAGTYFWRVQAADSTGQSAWSEPQSFTVTGAGPGTPGTPVLAPTRGYSTFHPWEAIHFDWTAVPDAVTYRLEVSNDPNFPVGPVPAGTVTFWNDNIPNNSDGYIHTMVGNWFARVFAVSADNPQEGIRSLPSNVIEFSCFFDNPIGPPPVLISPLGNPTLTLPVTIRWEHVPNPQPGGYLWEVARDPGFTDIEVFSNQNTEPFVELLSLSSGPKFWRVLSQHGLSSPTTNANTAFSSTGTFTIASEPSTPVSIVPRGNSDLVMYSGAFGFIAVQLTAGVPDGGATLALSSSHPAVLPVPATLSVQGGHAWTQFPINVGQVTSPTVVTLTATLNGASASSQVTVRPPTLNDQILQSVVRATGGTTMSGWVNLEGGGLAGANGFPVNLSTDSSAASVPATVTIPAGAGGTSFPIQTSPVTSDTTVTITASAGSVTSSWKITLTAEPSPKSLLVRPASTTNGSQGVVNAAEGVGHEQIMRLASSNPSLAAVPDTVTVSASSGIGFFNITTARVTAPTEVSISVTGGGVTLSQPLTLYPSLPALTSMTVSPGSVAGGTDSTGTVTLAGPAPAVGVKINLGSSQPLIASVPDIVTIPSGATSASFTVTTFPINFTSTVQLSASMDSVFQFTSITVGPAAPAGPSLAAISVNPTSVTGGSSSTGTVTLSAAAPSGGVVVSLSDNSSATSVPASVTVPAGSTSGNFTITTTSVTTSTPATISAVAGGVTRTVALTVNPPAPGRPSLISPANDARPAQPVTFDWSDVTGAASYEIQIDNTSTISAPFVASATPNVSQATIGDLPAQRLWWRVRARNSAGVFGPFSSTRRFTPQASTTTTPTLSAVSLAPSTVVGGAGSTGTATLTAAAPTGGAVVSLSSDSGVASVPASVTIAAGATSATFAVTTVAVTASSTATITASFGGATRSATLTIAPPASLSSVSLAPAAVTGGSPSTGTVTLTSAAPSGGVSIALASSNTAVATVPASVTIAAGATSATFAVTTVAVTASSTATITASFGGATRSATLTIAAPASLSSLSLAPATVTGGSPSTGTVTLTSAAPSGGVSIALASSNTAVATVPASVTITAGATTASFTVSTQAVTASANVSITAASGAVNRTAVLTVAPQASGTTLSVTATGRSGERVISSPTGINVAVGSTQSASFGTGTTITLSVSNGRDAIWSGACSSGGEKTETCAFTLNASAAVTANVQ
jgi:hypothetical protein